MRQRKYDHPRGDIELRYDHIIAQKDAPTTLYHIPLLDFMLRPLNHTTPFVAS